MQEVDCLKHISKRQVRLALYGAVPRIPEDLEMLELECKMCLTWEVVSIELSSL
jgi:hypothetical protein